MLSALKRVVLRRKKTRVPGPVPPRLGALEALWGRGRYDPSSGALDDMILDRLGFGPSSGGPTGLIGADSVLAGAAGSRFGAEVTLAEWRGPCAERSADLEPDLTVRDGALDRGCVFDNESLDGLVSVNATVYATHKTTVVANAYRSLRSGGVWVIFDILRSDVDGEVDEEVFASAWSDGQPSHEGDLSRMLGEAGFELSRRDDISEVVADTARQSFAHFERRMGSAGVSSGAEQELLLRELSWEATSWRARMAALRDESLRAILWVAVKSSGGSGSEASSLEGESS